MKDDNQNKSVLETTCTDDYTGNVILHISDLHFIKNTDEVVITKNEIIQRDLIRRLQELPELWKPNILCITGDISDKNNEGGYKQAQIFISSLADELGIPLNNIVICPGNHDFSREKANNVFHNKTIQKIMDDFVVPIPPIYDEIFFNYIALCEKLKIPKCIYGDHTSYLFGIRTIGNINFIICNANWFYTKEPSLLKRLINRIFNNESKTIQSVENGAQICLPLLVYLENKHDLLKKRQEHRGFFIGLLHHPSDELADKEKYRRSISNNPPTADYLAKRVDLVLTGHKHGLPLGIGSFLSAPSINCGSTLKETSIDKAFYIVKVTDNQIKYISFKIDPLSSENKWIRDGQEDSILNPIMQKKINEFADTNDPQSPLIDLLANSVGSKQPSSNTYLSHLEEVAEKLKKAERHIEKLEFAEAFGITDEVKKVVESLGSSMQGDELSDIYRRIALIECTRASCLHLNQGAPEDYSVAKKYLERAKNAKRK